MRREELDHAVRAAGAVLGERNVIVIGSQAIYGSVEGDPPAEALRSVEVDVAAFDDADERKADLIDGSIGEASMFHETFGYYAQGVAEAVAILPDGWRDRLVPYESPGTSGVTAWCLELHDLWISKAAAGREKDLAFCRALLARRLVDPPTLAARLDDTPGISEPVRRRIRGWVELPASDSADPA